LLGLRNEDYVAFVDESIEPGTQGLTVVAGILIPARLLRSAERRWRDFISDRLGSRSGRREIKSKELTKGRGAALHAQKVLLNGGWPALSAKGAGHQFYREALEHIASITEIRVLTVGLSTKKAVDGYRLWFWMSNVLLVEHRRAPRPRLPLIVIDGRDTALRNAQDLVAWRFYKAFPRCQPYVGGGSRWFVGGSVLQDSALSPFIQMADLVAGAGRLAIAQKGPEQDWYRHHLVQPAHKLGRTIDVSKHARSELRRRSREDACGSRWQDALLVP
jgi:Protein of unknown function (DUF3800)